MSDKFGRGIGYQKDVQFARNAGLYIENIHTPVHEQNFLSGVLSNFVFQIILKIFGLG